MGSGGLDGGPRVAGYEHHNRSSQPRNHKAHIANPTSVATSITKAHKLSVQPSQDSEGRTVALMAICAARPWNGAPSNGTRPTYYNTLNCGQPLTQMYPGRRRRLGGAEGARGRRGEARASAEATVATVERWIRTNRELWWAVALEVCLANQKMIRGLISIRPQVFVPYLRMQRASREKSRSSMINMLFHPPDVSLVGCCALIHCLAG